MEDVAIVGGVWPPVARILVTLLNEMRRRQLGYGMIAICGGGGMGVSGILEPT